jgi:hypothetical protein
MKRESRKQQRENRVQEQEEHRRRIEETVARWFADPDTWAGVFENQALDSATCGERCAFPFKLSDGSFERAEVGKSHAPDGATIGLGWKYVLVAKCKFAEDAVAGLRGEQA